MRSLTARAVQKLMLQLTQSDLGPVDSYSATWLNQYCAKHRPLDGHVVRVVRCCCCLLLAWRGELWRGGGETAPRRSAAKQHPKTQTHL